MKKTISVFTLMLATVLTLSMTSCRETKEDKAEEAVEDVKEGVEDAAEGLGLGVGGFGFRAAEARQWERRGHVSGQEGGRHGGSGRD